MYKVKKFSVSSQKGMTFLEVLIALVIMVTGILGAVALQTVAKQSSFDTMQRSIASGLAQEIVDRMRGNNSNNIALYAAGSPYGDGSVVSPVDCSVFANNCTAAQLALYDLFEWEQSLIGAYTKYGTQNAGGLTNGVGCINVVGNQVTIAVSWQGKTESSDGATSSDGDSTCGTSITAKKRRQVVVNAFIL